MIICDMCFSFNVFCGVCSVLFAVSWRIKAEIDESVRLAEGDLLDDPDAPALSPGTGVDQHDRQASTSSSRGYERIPSSLHMEGAKERYERLSRHSRASGSRSVDGGFPGVDRVRHTSFADMFTPAPIEDEDGRLRINSFTPV